MDSIKQFPKLYKITKNNKIASWRIAVKELHTATVLTYHGYVHGVKQTDAVEVYAGKNIGKVNETTPLEQAIKIAQSKWNKQIDRGYTELATGKSTKAIVLPMLAQKYKERSKHIAFPCFVQPKLNGARCLSYVLNGKRLYQSRLGKIWTTLDGVIPKQLSTPTILDGEIYHPKLMLQEILSLIKNTDMTKNIRGYTARDLEYHIYDVVSEDAYLDRLSILEHWDMHRDILLSPKIHIVQTNVCENEAQLITYYHDYLDKGYEGAIARNWHGTYARNKRSNDLQKIKPLLSEEFEIIGGYAVETGREKGTCIFECLTQEGLRFHVRPTGTLAQRIDYYRLLPSLIGKMLTCDFQEWTLDKKPFHCRGIAIRDYE